MWLVTPLLPNIFRQHSSNRASQLAKPLWFRFAHRWLRGPHWFWFSLPHRKKDGHSPCSAPLLKKNAFLNKNTMEKSMKRIWVWKTWGFLLNILVKIFACPGLAKCLDGFCSTWIYRTVSYDTLDVPKIPQSPMRSEKKDSPKDGMKDEVPNSDWSLFMWAMKRNLVL